MCVTDHEEYFLKSRLNEMGKSVNEMAWFDHASRKYPYTTLFACNNIMHMNKLQRKQSWYFVSIDVNMIGGTLTLLHDRLKKLTNHIFVVLATLHHV